MRDDEPAGGQQRLPADTSQQRSTAVVVTLLFSISFTSNVIISLLYPFAPVHLAAQGYGPSFIGMIFSVYSWAMLVSTPISAALVARFGRSTMLCLGIVMISFFSSAFGYAEQLSMGDRFLMSCIYVASRVLSGLGAALTNLSVFSMATDSCQNDLGKVMGANEVVIGLGFTVGPPIGSLLYVNFGFGQAFLLAAGAVMLSFPLALYEAISRHGAHSEMKAAQEAGTEVTGTEEAGVFERISRVFTLRAVLGGLLCFSGTFVFGVMEPNLAQHLRESAGMSQTAVGMVFAFFSATYSLSGVPLGWLADARGHFGVCTCGVLFAGSLMTLLGVPIWDSVSAATGMQLQTVVMVKDVALLGMLGSAQAALLVPTLPAIKGGVKYNDPATTEMVVTLFNCFQQLGLAIGPLAGAALVMYTSYETSLAVTGVWLLAIGLVCLVNLATTKASPCPFLDNSEIEQGLLDSEDPFQEDATSPIPISSSRRTSLARMPSLSRSIPLSIH